MRYLRKKYREYLAKQGIEDKIKVLAKTSEQEYVLARNILLDSIDINTITLETVDRLSNNIDYYKLIIELAIGAKNYDILWYLINLNVNLLGNDAYDRKVMIIVCHLNKSNYFRILELLYIYNVNIRRKSETETLDKKLAYLTLIYTGHRQLEYVIRFVTKVKNQKIEQLFDRYLVLFHNILDVMTTISTDFYNSFLNAGLPLSYFREKHGFASIQKWLSKITEDI